VADLATNKQVVLDSAETYPALTTLMSVQSSFSTGALIMDNPLFPPPNMMGMGMGMGPMMGPGGPGMGPGMGPGGPGMPKMGPGGPGMPKMGPR
jgi:hypothetical protein